MVALCSFKNCLKPMLAKKLCNAHYVQQYKGLKLTPLVEYKVPPKGSGMSDTEWFWVLANVKGEDECWLWQGGKIPAGYGKYVYHGESVYAHRLAYELTYNLSLYGRRLRRICIYASCVNPNHMELTARPRKV